jgi:hypothetical protein
MDKAERRRRRRRFDQDTEAEPAATTAESPEVAPEDSADAVPPAALEELPPTALEELPPAPAEAVEPAEMVTHPQPASPPRPVAMAEVIGSGFPQTIQTAETDEGSAKPNLDPFFQHATPRTEFHSAESVSAPVAEPHQPPPPPPPPPPDPAPRLQTPPPAQARSPRRDPVLLALLLAALVVLTIDTYFILRLNGLSDRLSGMAAKSAAGATASATDRPWIGIGGIKTAPFANGGQPVTTVRFGNSGSQPAYDFRSNTVGSLRPSGSPPPDIPAQAGPVASAGVLVPNAEGLLTFFANTRALTPDEAARVRSGQLVLWLAGRLDYRDPRRKQHLTTFRYQYNPSLNSFVAAPQGNTAS